jgi:hypothetical protein
MKAPNRPITLTLLLALLFLTPGCEKQITEQDLPELEMAASLTESSMTTAAVDENLDLALIFDSPMEEMVTDLDLGQDPEDFDPWTGGGVSFPERTEINAKIFGDLRSMGDRAAALPAGKRAFVEACPTALEDLVRGAIEAEPGDTISVEYFDTPDSSGLRALIMVALPSRVSFVALTHYPDRFLPNVIRRLSEVALDTMDTPEDGNDDEIYGMRFEEEWDNGHLVTGDIAPETGDGPLGNDVLAVSHHRVDNPMWQPLQSWRETFVTLDPGDIENPVDDQIYSLENTVHWISDAEQSQRIREVAAGPIVDSAEVEISAVFTAAPGNLWIESTTDGVRVIMGDLEDPHDDQLLSMSRETVFDALDANGNNSQSSIAFTPESPVSPGDEPCGGEATESATFPADWWLQSRLREADLSCDGAGTLHVLLEFKNGSSYERWIEWGANGDATLTENRLNGTSVSGTWTAATGEYEVTTTFPAGNDPIRREQSGQVQEGSITARDELIWQNGHPHYKEFTASETDSTLTASGTRVFGNFTEEFSITGSEDLLTNIWSRTGPNTNASGESTLEALEGGGGHLVFSAEDPAALGEPSVVGEAWIAPDGSGYGTVTVTQYGVTISYDLEWDADGQGDLSDGEGNATPLDG